MRTIRYSSPLRTASSILFAACLLVSAAVTSAAASLQTSNGTTVDGDIQFTTGGSVFVQTEGQQVTRLKKNELTDEASAAVNAWEASNPSHAALSTKFDSKPQPVKMKTPDRTPDISDASGIVMLAVVVDEAGGVEAAFVKDSSDPRFNDPSVDAMRNWAFAPLTKDAKPTRGLMFVPLQY